MTTTAERVALVSRYLPDAAKDSVDNGGYGWTEEVISNFLVALGLSPAQTVRFFWYQRVQETAEYLDLSKPLTQIHRQAKEMLDYWDLIIQGNVASGNPDGMEPLDPSKTFQHKTISFGEIQRPWECDYR